MISIWPLALLLMLFTSVMGDHYGCSSAPANAASGLKLWCTAGNDGNGKYSCSGPSGAAQSGSHQVADWNVFGSRGQNILEFGLHSNNPLFRNAVSDKSRSSNRDPMRQRRIRLSHYVWCQGSHRRAMSCFTVLGFGSNFRPKMRYRNQRRLDYAEAAYRSGGQSPQARKTMEPKCLSWRLEWTGYGGILCELPRGQSGQ